MPFPRVSDDGRSVELDLHGATVAEAERMIRRLVPMAAKRGRSTVRIIHGISTSETNEDRPTIRGTLMRMLDEGSLDRYVTDRFSAEGSTTLALGIASGTDASRIRLQDIL